MSLIGLEDLALFDQLEDAIEDSAVNRLMIITGVNLVAVAGIMAAIGDISRFNGRRKLVRLVPRPGKSLVERLTEAKCTALLIL